MAVTCPLLGVGKSVTFRLEEASAILEVEDDGVGFTVPAHWVEMARQRHLGLVGIQERAETVGGVCEILSRFSQGTRVSVAVPRRVPDMSAADETVLPASLSNSSEPSQILRQIRKG